MNSTACHINLTWHIISLKTITFQCEATRRNVFTSNLGFYVANYTHTPPLHLLHPQHPPRSQQAAQTSGHFRRSKKCLVWNPPPASQSLKIPAAPSQWLKVTPQHTSCFSCSFPFRKHEQKPWAIRGSQFDFHPILALPQWFMYEFLLAAQTLTRHIFSYLHAGFPFSCR